MIIRLQFIFLFAFIAINVDAINSKNGIYKASKIFQQFRKVQNKAVLSVDSERKKDEYIENIMTPYGTPEPFSRIVKMAEGERAGMRKLVSVDKSMQEILNFVQLKLGMEHAALRDLNLPKEGCFLSFHFDKNINAKVFRFDVGTRISEEDIEHLELFEERETGRKMIIDKEGKRERNKKGELMGGNKKKLLEKEGKEEKEEEKEEKKEVDLKGKKKMEGEEEEEMDGKGKKEGEEEEDEEENEEDEQTVIKLSTYASLGAIQKGAEVFVDDATLDMKNMPELSVIRSKKLLAAVDDLFTRIIDACDGKMDLSAIDFDDMPEEKFDMSEFLNRIKEQEGKMKSQDDLNMYERDLREMMEKIVRSVQVASDYDRAEIKALVMERKQEFDEMAKLDHNEMERLREEKKKVYEFLKTVRFAINARPAFKEFKQLSFDEFEELVALTDDFGKLKKELADLEERHKMGKEEGAKILEAAKNKEIFRGILKGMAEKGRLNAKDHEALLESIEGPKLAELLEMPLREKLDPEECKAILDAGNDGEKFKKKLLEPKVHRKMSNEEHRKLMNSFGNLAKLRELIEGKMSNFHRQIADNLIHGKKVWYSKAWNWAREAGKKLGQWVGKNYVLIAKFVGLKKSKEITSGEKREKERKETEALKRLNKERRAALEEAVQKIRQNKGCHQLKQPIKIAIYGDEVVMGKRDSARMAKDKATEDLRARLGAQAMNAVLNTKRFPEGHGLAVAMSVGGSGTIGIILDVLMIPIIVWGLTGIAGPIPFIGAIIVSFIKVIIKPILESTTPLVAETFDSAIIKQYLDSLKGGKFWRGIKHFRKTLIEAFESGKIAAIGSVFYNFVMLSSHPWMLPVQVVANVISTIASAAQIPIELIKARDEIIKGIHYKMESGFFRKLPKEMLNKWATDTQKAIAESNKKFWGKMFPKKLQNMHPKEGRNMAYMSWLERQTWRTMEIEQSSRLAINSLGVGPIVSSAVFLLMQYFQSTDIVPEEMVNAISVMFNSPTEMISMTGAILGANNLGFEKCPWLLSTDEQKNGLIMGEIFAKTKEQIEKGGQLVEISDEKMHKIYNPFLGVTMLMGKFFAKSGMSLKEKWDKFNGRNEYWMKEMSKTIRGTNPNKLVVENMRREVVYLITLPRTSSAQNLSPKALALEYWLKMQKTIRFYRISDGFLMPELFTNSIPYVELNGQKIVGTTQQIIEKLSGKVTEEMKKFEAKYLMPLEILLVADRKRGSLKHLMGDKGLITELISTMSQIFPKMLEYEADYVDSWDTMPGQLKGVLNKMGGKIEEYLKKMKVEMEKNHQKVVGLESGQEIIEEMKKIEGILEKNGGKYLFRNEPTYLDGILFGLLVQFFETPQTFDAVNEYFNKIKNDKANILHQYYQKRIEEMTGEKEGKVWNELRNEPWKLNFDAQKFEIETEKYNGQFGFDFVRSFVRVNKETMEIKPAEKKLEERVNKLEGIASIMGEGNVSVGKIKEAMRAEKVNHHWLGPLWKMQKEWGEKEFAQELERRISKEKRELYDGHVKKRILGVGDGVHKLSPALAAVVEKVLDVVWGWTGKIQEFMGMRRHFKEILEELEKRRKAKLAEVGAAFGFNERTREFVKTQIGRVNLAEEREGIEEKLGEERAMDFRMNLMAKIVEGMDKSGVERELEGILGVQREIVVNIREALKRVEAKGGLGEKLEEVKKKYRKIEKMIMEEKKLGKEHKEIKKEIGIKMEEIEEIKKEIGEFLGKYSGKSAKKMILEALGGITSQMVHENVRKEKLKIMFIKWEDKLSKEEVERKRQRIEHLRGILEANTEIEKPEKELGKINEKIEKVVDNILGTEEPIGGEWKEKLDNWGIFESGKKTAKLLVKLETIEDAETREMVTREVAEMYKRDLEGRRVDKIKKGKYPLAKAMLHLAASYLCEGRECGKRHEEWARGILGQRMAVKKNVRELLPSLRKLVFHAIADFNENNVIREEILAQYGLPMKNIVENAFDEHPFWDTESRTAKHHSAGEMHGHHGAAGAHSPLQSSPHSPHSPPHSPSHSHGHH